MPDELLIDVREDETFLGDKRDLEAALIYARPFATTEPFADRKQAGEAADAINGLRLVLDAAEENRKAITKSWRESTKHVDAHYKELTANVKAAIDGLKRKALTFKQAEEALIRKRQREEQERLDREAEARAAEAQAAAEKVAAEPQNPDARQEQAAAHEAAARAAVATAPTPAPPKQLRGGFGAISTRTEYRFEVTDPASIPAEFVQVNEKAIKAAIKGERAMAKAQERPFNLELIPGVRISPEEVAVSR